MRRWILLGGLCLSLAACDKTQKLMERAREEAFQQAYAAAITDYDQVLLELTHNESAEARELRSQVLRATGDIFYLHLKDYTKAAQRYHELAEQFPEHPETFEARVNLSDILRDHFGDRRAALAELAALVQSFPNHLETDRYQYRAALDYFELRDYHQAETELRLFLNRYSGSSLRGDAQNLLASALALQGRTPEAIQTYLQVAREHPGADAAKAYLEIGRLYEESGDMDKAETNLALALANYPDPKVVQIALNRVRRRVALSRPVDIHNHDAIFDHAAGKQVAEGGD
jgi:TolA-binding protein